jgi:hypothetical protein
MWSLSSFCGLSFESKLGALTLNFEFSYLDLLRSKWTRGGILVSRSSTTSCIRSGNLSDLTSKQIVKGNKGKGFISRYKINKLEN